MMTAPRSGRRERLEESGRGPCLLRPLVTEVQHLRPAALAYEIVLEGERAFRRLDDGRHRIVAHGQDARLDAEPRAQCSRDRAQALARPQSPGTLDMDGEVLVAEEEPGLAAERAERRHEGAALPCPPPAGLRVREPGEGVGERVEVGADLEAEMLEVVAGVGDDGEPGGVVKHVAEPECELGAADTPGERHVAGAHDGARA